MAPAALLPAACIENNLIFGIDAPLYFKNFAPSNATDGAPYYVSFETLRDLFMFC